ncbi:MAG: Bax inhibitor-1/YccA family protein, partial [Propionibacterium sp.]|nr:Bax inhibitor-1/YccA family protein [Propionibacterium sp.]
FIFSISGFAVVAGINLSALLFGVNLGFFNIGAGAGALSWLFAGIGVVLAVASLLMDFEECERGVRMGAPAKESWRAGFGLMVTMVWLYTNLLRILSFFRN